MPKEEVKEERKRDARDESIIPADPEHEKIELKQEISKILKQSKDLQAVKSQLSGDPPRAQRSGLTKVKEK